MILECPRRLKFGPQGDTEGFFEILIFPSILIIFDPPGRQNGIFGVKNAQNGGNKFSTKIMSKNLFQPYKVV